MAPQNNSNNMDNIWILDGGTGREIERRGGPFRQPEWSALALYEDPDIVRDIHASFIIAGATAISTNTYAIVPFHLGRDRYDKDKKWLLELAVDLAVQAKANSDRTDIQIMGSIPPISGSYQPGSFNKAIAGPIIHDFLTAFHGKVDAIILETMGSAQEAKFALETIEQFYQEKQKEQQTSVATPAKMVPVYLSLYVQADLTDCTNAPRLLTGDTLSEAMKYLQEECGLLTPTRVPLIMVNCCDIALVDAALEELSVALDIKNNSGYRIGAYPNAFSAKAPTAAANEKAREIDTHISPTILRDMTQRWNTKYGATAFGGCCGIGPDHIRAVAEGFQNHDGDTTAGASKKEEQQSPTVVVSRVCRIQGCGCGVQIGFGQDFSSFLCGSILPATTTTMLTTTE